MSEGRPPPRFEIDEEPGDEIHGSKAHWMGAFERVLGDQADCLSSDQRHKGRKGAASSLMLGGLSHDARGPRQMYDDHYIEKSSRSSTGSSGLSSGGNSPSVNTALDSVTKARIEEEWNKAAQGRWTSLDPERPSAKGSAIRGVKVTDGLPSCATTKDTSTTHPLRHHKSSSGLAPTPTANSRSSYGDLPSQFNICFEPIRSGPQLVAITNINSAALQQTYVNHAPSVHPMKVTNVSEGLTALVRMETDLRRGISFMRRKKSAPANGLDLGQCPSNTVAWAAAGGLSPANIRAWRHMVANFERVDSFILDPGASTDLFVVMRPAVFAEENDTKQLQRWSSTNPTSPVVPQASKFSQLPREVSLDGNLISTPSPEGAADGSYSGVIPSAEAASFEPTFGSPQSAPELDSAASRLHARAPAYPAFEIRGSLSIRAWPLPQPENAPTEENANEAHHSNWSSTSSSRPPSFYSSTNASSATSSSASASVSYSPENEEMQLIQLPFAARLCRPVIEATVERISGSRRTDLAKPQFNGLITLDFGDIIVGEAESQTLDLHNLSEIDCFWQPQLEEADNMLQSPPVSILDANSGELVPTIDACENDTQYSPSKLASLSTQRLLVSLRPLEPCRDYEQVITLSNLHNSANSIRVVVRANMLGAAKDDALTVLSGNVLDFGDCYGGHWTRQLIVLKNTADVMLDVAFGVQKGIEATFQLAELAPQVEDDGVTEDEHFPVGSASEISLPISDEASRMSFIEGSLVADSGRPDDLESMHGTTASELARTPTHHAHVNHAQPEPPRLELSSLPSPGGLEDLSDPKPGENDVDASSVASQAGSRSNSPTREARVPANPSRTLFFDTPKDSLASRLERADTGPAFIPEHGANFKRALSEGGRGSVFSNIRSQTSSGLLSRPPSRGRVAGIKADELERAEDDNSARSEATALSQDSRIGPFAATSSHTGSNTSSRFSRIGGGGVSAAISGLRSVEQAHSNQLEELVLRPGGEYRVVVSYRPPREEADEEYTAGRLVERSFRISLDYAPARAGNTRTKGGRERKTIICQSRTCTSFISLSPKLIDFGEANVGTRKSAYVSVTNRSELTARVDLRFVSKVLSMYRDEVAIPALQTVDLKVESFPRRVNESYRKQITVANLMNRHNDQIFEVRSQNIDKQRVSFHSLFYRILTPTGSNFIDFGDVSINSTKVRTFSIENTSMDKLALELSTSNPEDVTLYVKAPPSLSPKDSDSAQSSSASNVHSKKLGRYAETSEAASAAENEAKAKVLKPSLKGADLKERFLEIISVDSPASIRKENASWRLAQKQSHYSKKKDSTSAKSADGKDNKPKAPINLMSALKKGGKGRITMVYGKGITFKDRKLLGDFEYLDLATGPPVDQKRISVKSKKYQMLETLETGHKPKSYHHGSNAKPKTSSSVSAANSGEASSGETKSAKKPKASAKRLPSPLSKDKDIRSKGSPPPSINGALALATPSTPKKESAPSTSETGARVHFSPALTGKKKAQPVLSNPTDVSKLSIEDLLVAIESQNSSLSSLFLGNAQAEEQYVRTEINLQREVQSSIDSGRLLPIDILEMGPEEEKQVIAVYRPNASTRPHIQGNARKQDSRVFLRLVEFNMDIVRSSSEFSAMAELDRDELPVRDLMMRSTTCRSLLELGQPHINFGHMEKGDSKARKIVIQNRSEWALRYCIRKSGSIASGDIKLSGGRYGVVPGYGKREIEFVFSPSMSGQFQEKLIVENVADRDNDQTVVLKANVRKVPNFAVDPASIDFGACQPGKISTAESFVLSNTTAKSRTFVVAIDPHDLLFQRCIMDVILSTANEGDVRGTLSKEEEEEIENISQKLKIATRKGNLEKVKKYEDRLIELGVKPPPASTAAGTGEPSNSSDAQDSAASDGKAMVSDSLPETADSSASTMAPVAPVEDPASRLKRVSSTVTVGLAANQSKRLLLRVRASGIQSALRPKPGHDELCEGGILGVEAIIIPVRIHEVKNQDETKIVTVKANVELDASKIESGQEEVEEALPTDGVVFSPQTPS
ncbi:hypothetical protein IE53DRAFT_367903 [Violaceomyces palustris]|uniref:Uncharacterized protein n=1 Tax=Violaceomyces palustris TaxID=1673888 RepID=A0ACD0P108_9BASI|nr:hypothetical protein IE53DRAFT_367903 [Violaceomyces palustris]